MTRITTRTELLRHYRILRADFTSPASTNRFVMAVACMATINCNQEHDPSTGFHRWKDATPEWVQQLKARFYIGRLFEGLPAKLARCFPVLRTTKGT